MDPSLDMEIVKSAILFGDVDDAYSRIKKSMERIEIYKRMTKSTKYDSYFHFLELLSELVKGSITIGDFKEKVSKIPSVDTMFDKSEEAESYLSSLMYFLEYCIDRYNIRYPSFDGKRCDDR